MGLLFPVCECAIVPIVRKLIQKGAPPAAAIAFMLGAPIVNPIVFGTTAVAYGLSRDFAFLRKMRIACNCDTRFPNPHDKRSRVKKMTTAQPFDDTVSPPATRKGGQGNK